MFLGSMQNHGMGTYCMPSDVTVSRSPLRLPRRSTTIAMCIFASRSNPSLVGCEPRYNVGVTSPRFGRPLTFSLRAILRSTPGDKAAVVCRGCAPSRAAPQSSATIANKDNTIRVLCSRCEILQRYDLSATFILGPKRPKRNSWKLPSFLTENLCANLIESFSDLVVHSCLAQSFLRTGSDANLDIYVRAVLLEGYENSSDKVRHFVPRKLNTQPKLGYLRLGRLRTFFHDQPSLMKIEVHGGEKRFCFLRSDGIVSLCALRLRSSIAKVTPGGCLLEKRKIALQFPLGNIIEPNLFKKVSQFVHREIGNIPAVVCQGYGNELLFLWLQAGLNFFVKPAIKGFEHLAAGYDGLVVLPLRHEGLRWLFSVCQITGIVTLAFHGPPRVRRKHDCTSVKSRACRALSRGTARRRQARCEETFPITRTQQLRL